MNKHLFTFFFLLASTTLVPGVSFAQSQPNPDQLERALEQCLQELNSSLNTPEIDPLQSAIDGLISYVSDKVVDCWQEEQERRGFIPNPIPLPPVPAGGGTGGSIGGGESGTHWGPTISIGGDDFEFGCKLKWYYGLSDECSIYADIEAGIEFERPGLFSTSFSDPKPTYEIELGLDYCTEDTTFSIECGYGSDDGLEASLGFAFTF